MNEAREGARGRDRREFLKKAGAVAWVVPTMQVVNMAAAAAGVAGSAVPPPPPPPSTSQGPGCRTCRLRAVWEPGRGFVWTDGAVEQGDCLGLPADAEISNGASVGARIEGDGTELIVRLLDPWRAVEYASQSVAGECSRGERGDRGRMVTFRGGEGDAEIRILELIISTCDE